MSLFLKEKENVTFSAANKVTPVFIASVWHLWSVAIASGVAALTTILYWLWTGTAQIPPKAKKDVGLGVKLPIYVSGPGSIGWWGMLVAMVGNATAFASLVFAYFYYWTIHEIFPPQPGPGLGWPALGCAALLLSWALTWFARVRNQRHHPPQATALLLLGALLCAAGLAAWVLAPLAYGLDPTEHVYPAIVWVLVIWIVVHGAIGAIMQLYCVARIAAGRLTPTHDIDLANITLYWHFLAATAVVTFGTLSLFPMVSN